MISKVQFLECVEHQPELAVALYRDACVRHLLAHHTAQTIALYDVETRLLRFLLDLAGLYGDRDSGFATISRPVTQVDMAASLGVTRKTIQRTVKSLEEKRLLARQRDTWVVHRLHDLQEILPPSLLGLSSRLGRGVQPVLSRVLELDG